MKRTFTTLCKRWLILCTGIIISCQLFAQSNSENLYLFTYNKGQYPSQVTYKAVLGGGLSLFMEKDRFTFLKFDPAQIDLIHEESHKKGGPKDGMVNYHAFQMIFKNANLNTQVSSSGKSSYYTNYFRGNDPSKWASEVYSYTEVMYHQLYPGVDLHAYQTQHMFKYDLIVAPHTDASVIRLKISGADGLEIKNNQLIIHTTTGDIIENTPYSYQEIEGIKTEVPCKYRISEQNEVEFIFPSGYNTSYPLIIDPVMVAASYSGAPSSTMTFGHCATYDGSGNIYTGGECFDPGYPTTVGAFQGSFAGNVDIAIGKLNPNGSSLIWASYAGGTDRDIPNSLFVNAGQEIYILGASSSSDYPTTAGCFDNSQNGMEDIVVTHFNTSGTALVGSTYIGGSNNDGGGWVSWTMNGHDAMRGEIIVDGANNAWIASFTSSTNFPVTAGTYDNTLDGTWDAAVFRLSPNMGALQWSTFLGGSGDDGAYGLRLNATGELYTTGITQSPNFPVSATAYDNTHNGGSDAFMARFNPAGNAVSAATFLGTAQNEIGYFMDIDLHQNVYVYGVSEGVMPVTAGVYSNPNSGNYVSKFDPGLNNLVFSTVFGDGTNWHLEPEAFMVDQCENVYVSGFGSSGSYPVTPDGLYTTQAAAGGGSCYFLVLEKDAVALSYGSFYYGWHVDGGTSRFDPTGAIYQGICIGSGGATTPAWAYKDNTGAPSWDMYVVKIDFEQQGVVANAVANPTAVGCAPFTVNFTNNSTNAISYFWDFDDGGATSTTAQPTHTFNNPGTYNVMLVAIDTSTCNISDTTYITIQVGGGANVAAGFTYQLFSCGNYTLQATNTSAGSQVYQWNFGDGNTSSALNPSHTYAGLGPWIVQLIAIDTVCNGADTITQTILFTPPTVPIANFNAQQSPNCNAIVVNTQNTSANAHTYTWNWGDGNTSGGFNPSHTYTNPGTYVITLTAFDTICNQQSSVQINITVNSGLVVNIPDGEICQGQPATLDAGAGANSYVWSTGDTTQSIQVTNPGSYTVTVTLGNCTTVETVNLTPLIFNPAPDTPLACPFKVVLHAGNGMNYHWSTGATTESITVSDEVTVWYNKEVGYCVVSDTIVVRYRYKSPDVYIPNTFTPNNDGLNEVFNVVGADEEEYEFIIFNRWGQIIFQTHSPAKGWDGTYKNGTLVPQGTYVWKVTYKNYCMAPVIQTKFGHVNVIR